MTTTSKRRQATSAEAAMPAGAMTVETVDDMPQPGMNAAIVTTEREDMPAGAMAVTAAADMPAGAMQAAVTATGADMPGGAMEGAGSDMPMGTMQDSAGAGEAWQMDVAEGQPCGCN